MKCLAWNPDSCSTQQIELIASDERHVRSNCPVLSQLHWFSRTCLLHSAQCRAARSRSPPSTTFDQPCRQKFVGALFTWQVLCNLCSLSQIYFVKHLETDQKQGTAEVPDLPLEGGGDDSWLRRELHAFCRIRGVFIMHTAPMQARERWPRRGREGGFY